MIYGLRLHSGNNVVNSLQALQLVIVMIVINNNINGQKQE